MKYAVVSNTLQNDGNYEQELILIVSAQSAKEALWRAGIENAIPGYGRFYEAVPVKRYSAHLGGHFDVTFYMNAP